MWFQSLATTITQLLEQGNPLVFGALFLVSTVLEIGVPLPFVQDTVLVLMGYEPSGRLLAVAPAVMAALMAGRVLGSSILYWAARLLGTRIGGWLQRRFPRVLARARDLGSRLGRRTPLAVAIARLTPGLLTPSSIAAGLFRLKYLYFCAGVIISSVIPDSVEIAYGLAIRAGVISAGFTPSPALFILSLVLLAMLVWLGSWVWRRRNIRKQ